MNSAQGRAEELAEPRLRGRARGRGAPREGPAHAAAAAERFQRALERAERFAGANDITTPRELARGRRRLVGGDDALEERDGRLGPAELGAHAVELVAEAGALGLREQRRERRAERAAKLGDARPRAQRRVRPAARALALEQLALDVLDRLRERRAPVREVGAVDGAGPGATAGSRVRVDIDARARKLAAARRGVFDSCLRRLRAWLVGGSGADAGRAR